MRDKLRIKRIRNKKNILLNFFHLIWRSRHSLQFPARFQADVLQNLSQLSCFRKNYEKVHDIVLYLFCMVLYTYLACGCIAANTITGNGSICDGVTGQCPCKSDIRGRVCDRCAENSVNITSKCTGKWQVFKSDFLMKVVLKITVL